LRGLCDITCLSSLTALTVLALGCAPMADEGNESGLALTTQVDDWRDEVIYEVLVDRFANGRKDNDLVDGVHIRPGDLARHQGGDWRGLANNLDYIQDLGATTIWISPLVANVSRGPKQDGYHGYWANDFTRINARYGTLAELRQLVRKAHARGMKVIVDVVTNHTGQVFFYDFDGDGAAGAGEVEPRFSPHGPYEATVAWLEDKPHIFDYGLDRSGEPGERVLDARHFHRQGQTNDFLDRLQIFNGDFPTGLRDIDTEQDAVVRGMVDTYLRWVELTDVDGFRLDAVPHVPHLFWQRFARELRQELHWRGKERFLLLGEVFHGDGEVLAGYTREGGLDSVFDFPLKWQVVDGFLLDGKPASNARQALETNREHFPTVAHPHGIGLNPWQARVALVDNHDMARIRRELDDPFVAELAMTLIFTVDAIPSVYYGTEQELAGGWGDDSREVLWDTGYRRHTRMFGHLQKLSRLRRESLALRRGGLAIRYASEFSARLSAPGAGLLAYERSAADDRVLVAINGHPVDHARAHVETGFAAGTLLVDGLGVMQGLLRVEAGGQVFLDIPPRRALVLRRAHDDG